MKTEIMKKTWLLLIGLAIGHNLSSQEWKSKIPDNQDLKIQDFQTAFESYFDEHPELRGKRGTGYKQFKRWEWYWTQRVNPDGSFPKGQSVWHNWQQYASNHFGTSRSTLNKTWEALGPFHVPAPYKGEGVGRINCVAFHPTDTSTFWIGTPAGGLWKTTDYGANWTTNTDNLPVLGVSDIAIHPTTPNTMWIATGDGDMAHSLNTFGGAGYGDTKSIGILKSTNGGATWTNQLPLDVDDGTTIRRIVINPTDPDNLCAATSEGMLVTFDGGDNWSLAESGQFIDLELNPSDPDTLYASTMGDGSEIFVSSDGGASWTQTYSDSNALRINLEVTKANNNKVLALVANKVGEGFLNIVSSTDRGNSWTELTNINQAGNLLGSNLDLSGTDGQGSYDLAFAISPKNENWIYVGGVNAFFSEDNGQTWECLNYWSPFDEDDKSHKFPVVHADKHFMVFHPLRSHTLFECNDGGIWQSRFLGIKSIKTEWVNLSNGMNISQVYAMDASENNEYKFVMGLQDNSSRVHLSKADNWRELGGGDGMDCAIDDKNGYIYYSHQEGPIFRYHPDKGLDTTYLNYENLVQGSSWLAPFELDEKQPEIITAGFNEVIRSKNSGKTWEVISSFNIPVTISYLSVSPVNNQIIYAGVKQGIQRTTDAKNWTSVTNGLPIDSANISSVYAAPTDKDDVFVTFSGFDEDEKVYYSEDAGDTWENISGTGLPNVPVNSVVVDKFSEEIYVGTDVGVFIYTGNGTNHSWAKYGDKLPNVVVTDMKISYQASKLRVSTFGRGLWQADLNTKSPIASTKALVRANNGVKLYPNPSTNSITVELETEQPIELTVYNTLGIKMKSITSSNTLTEINISDLPTGVYYLGKPGDYFQDFTRFVKQ